jgi:hypothetical protein
MAVVLERLQFSNLVVDPLLSPGEDLQGCTPLFAGLSAGDIIKDEWWEQHLQPLFLHPPSVRTRLNPNRLFDWSRQQSLSTLPAGEWRLGGVSSAVCSRGMR